MDVCAPRQRGHRTPNESIAGRLRAPSSRGVATDLALGATALLYAVVTGVNDGGAILATGLKLPVPRVWVALAGLSFAVAAVPSALGTTVAETFTTRLVAFGDAASLPVLVGVLTALAVTLTLTGLGLPTSLTLATVGGLTGVGLGAGLPVSFSWVAYVLTLGVVAPLVGGLIATGAVRVLRGLRPGGPLRRLHLLGYALQCLAYAAGDAQKMLAVLAVALGVSAARTPWWGPVLIGSAFALGAVYGLPRAGRTLGGRLLAVRPVHAVTAEWTAGGAVLGSAALGSPVSMTQSITGGLIGAGVITGVGRVRWQAATDLVMAWLLTLPASVLIGVIGALLCT